MSESEEKLVSILTVALEIADEIDARLAAIRISEAIDIVRLNAPAADSSLDN